MGIVKRLSKVSRTSYTRGTEVTQYKFNLHYKSYNKYCSLLWMDLWLYLRDVQGRREGDVGVWTPRPPAKLLTANKGFVGKWNLSFSELFVVCCSYMFNSDSQVNINLNIALITMNTLPVVKGKTNILK